MKVAFWMIGKTSFPFITEGIQVYEKRLKHFLKLESQIFPDIKKAGTLSPNQLKEKEGAQFLNKILPTDTLILLDERGKEMDSKKFAAFVDQQFQHSSKRIVFVIGGAFGFSDDIKNRANHLLSLSKMTYSHQIIRVIFMEQLYRAMTILRNLPYHNE